MHYLAIAAKKEILPYLPIDWPKTELTELVNPASLAAVVIDEKDSRSRGIYQTMKEKLGLDLPLIEFTPETPQLKSAAWPRPTKKPTFPASSGS